MLKPHNNNIGQKRIIAFYLPQFHTIPENDKWWGEGFTEWTNTKKAVPLFNWHEQPKTPLNNNYYDLSDVEVMVKQAELAKRYGVYGFCYYHYWFKNGKKLLERPIEQMLACHDVDIPFCLCWANENWTRNWDGGNKEIIVEQDYGEEKEWKEHFEYLLEFFKDKRYILIDNSPLLIIYRPELIPHFNEMMKLYNELAKEAGYDGIIIVSQYPEINYRFDRGDWNIDYFIKFQPGMSLYSRERNNFKFIVKTTIKRVLRKSVIFQKLLSQKNKNKIQTSNKPKELEICDYDELWSIILNQESFSNRMISGGFTSWDNTARNRNGRIIRGSTPQKFEKYMTELLKKPSGMNLVFVNAWNEWAEGAYLEPDERYGYAYLEALKKAVDSQ